MDAESERRFAWLDPIKRMARNWFPPRPDAEFDAWRKRNPDKQFKDFFAETVRSRLRQGSEHASLGSNLRGRRFGEAGKTGFEHLVTFGLRQDHVCVDYGCGTLRLGVHIINYLPPGHYWGLDIDTYLLEEGKKLIGSTLLSEKRPHLHVISPESVAAAAKHKPHFLVSAKVLIHVHPQELGDFFGNILTIIGGSGRAVIIGKWSSEETIQLSERSWAHGLSQLHHLATSRNADLTTLKESAWHPETHGGKVRNGTLGLKRQAVAGSPITRADGT